MDSERKHELETNDLKEFLDNFKDFWDKHGNKLLIALIVVLGSYAAYNYYYQRKASKLEEAQGELASATSADDLRRVAGEYELVHDEAMRRAGDIYLDDARRGVIGNREGAAKKALTEAGSAYTAIAERGGTVEYQLVGYEGLAKVAVMSGQWDKAAAHYEKIVELAGEAHPAQAARAQTGLTRIDLLKDPIAFAPEDDISFNPDQETPGEDPDPDTETPTETPAEPVEPLLPGIDLPGLGQPGTSGTETPSE